MPTPTHTLAYYAEPGPLTDLRGFSQWIEPLPREIGALCEVVQGLVIHRAWAPAYGITLPEARTADAQARTAPKILARVLELSAKPLAEAREPIDRFAGTCRDFSVLLCALLRHQGVPARARCGFGAYFVTGAYEDHWICEWWDSARAAWVQTDAQIDALQRESLKLPFDPIDVPRDQFVVAGRVWDDCASGAVDPEKCGIFDMHGLWFVRANVLRDLASLNRVELLPWDDWGLLLDLREEEGSPEQRTLVARAATLTQAPDRHFEDLQHLYAAEPALVVPEKVRNWQTGADDVVRG